MSLIENKKVRFDYEILETLSAGIELLGLEVKALRAGQGTLEGAYVIVRGAEAFIVGMSITPLQPANAPKGYDPRKTRKLLLTRKEIAHLAKEEMARGLTIAPISVYNKSRKLKMDIAVVRGKKKFDKRETTKKREVDRETRRTLKYE